MQARGRPVSAHLATARAAASDTAKAPCRHHQTFARCVYGDEASSSSVRFDRAEGHALKLHRRGCTVPAPAGFAKRRDWGSALCRQLAAAHFEGLERPQSSRPSSGASCSQAAAEEPAASRPQSAQQAADPAGYATGARTWPQGTRPCGEHRSGAARVPSMPCASEPSCQRSARPACGHRPKLALRVSGRYAGPSRIADHVNSLAHSNAALPPERRGDCETQDLAAEASRCSWGQAEACSRSRSPIRVPTLAASSAHQSLQELEVQARSGPNEGDGQSDAPRSRPGCDVAKLASSAGAATAETLGDGPNVEGNAGAEAADDDPGLRVALALQAASSGALGSPAAVAGLQRASTLRMSRRKGGIDMHAASEAYVPEWKTRAQLTL